MQDVYDKIEEELGIILTSREKMIASKATAFNKLMTQNPLSPDNSNFYIGTFKFWRYPYHYEEYESTIQSIAEDLGIKVDIVYVRESAWDNKKKYKAIIQGNKKQVKAFKARAKV